MTVIQAKNVIQWVSGQETYIQYYRQSKIFENIKTACFLLPVFVFVFFFFGTTYSAMPNKKTVLHFLVYLIHSSSQTSIHLC